MGMSIKTKSAFYAQMSVNQFQAAYVLANSSEPRIQSIVWIQLAFLSLELSVKAYLINTKEITTENDLKNKVGHNFDKYLKNNPDVVTIFEKANKKQIVEFDQLLSFYKKQHLRYLNANLVFIGIKTEDPKSFLLFMQNLIAMNVKNLLEPSISNLLNH